MAPNVCYLGFRSSLLIIFLLAVADQNPTMDGRDLNPTASGQNPTWQDVRLDLIPYVYNYCVMYLAERRFLNFAIKHVYNYFFFCTRSVFITISLISEIAYIIYHLH